MTQQCIKEFNVIFHRSITGPYPDEFVAEDNTLQYGWILVKMPGDIAQEFARAPLPVAKILFVAFCTATFSLTPNDLAKYLFVRTETGW